jgi:NFACT N-terminal and middle domains/NFACT protein RNA binding domain
MDAITLDHLLGESASGLRGRPIRRVRAAGRTGLLLEVQRSVLWLDVARETSGLYPLDRPAAERLRASATGAPDTRSRHALLLIKKHLEGQRLGEPRRIAGERAVVLEAGAVTLWLRLARPAVLSLAVDGAPVAAWGGEPVWPPPAPDEGRGWTRLTFEAVAAAASAGDRGTGALLAACPELGAQIARRLVRAPSSWPGLREELASPRPLVALPGPLATLGDADLGSVELWPAALDPSHELMALPTWSAAAALFLELRMRHLRFVSRQRPLLDTAASAVRRLHQLERHLESDLTGLPAEADLRRQAEALLASAADAPGQSALELPDPYDPAVRLHVRLDPRLSVPANADRLFDRARRAARARVQVASRLEETRDALAAARGAETRLRSARVLTDLPEEEAARPSGEGHSAGPRRYLTSRGLMLLVGRGARENHELTFKVARPDDFWLHARDVPGAHVILRDPERRASPDDLREAAEVAAFFSAARESLQVDVHATRRKHVQPAGGGPGRVRVSHSETERVAPRDPEGRLRKR